MFPRASKIVMFTLGALLVSGTATAQVGSLAGKVLDKDGNGVQGALIKIERLEVRGNYQVKTNKKGNYFHAGLPLGRYKITCELNGQVVDRVNGVRVSMGDPTRVEFDMREIASRQAAASGQPTQEQLSALSPEERKKYEDALRKRQQQISKNKELNETFGSGMVALSGKDYQTAVTYLAKAADIDPEQHVVWANLAEAQSNLALTKTSEERARLISEGLSSYQKALALQPDNAAYHNNMGLALVKAGKLDEGKAELAKAAQLDPVNGGKYYFNLGAVMVNSGNTQGAVEAFQKATETDPNYADAYYQLAVALVSAAEVGPDGSVKPKPGTVDAFKKYLELKPDGPYAPSARQMIASLSGNVSMTYEDPTKKKKKRRKK